jgi:hypothetical protein
MIQSNIPDICSTKGASYFGLGQHERNSAMRILELEALERSITSNERSERVDRRKLSSFCWVYAQVVFGSLPQMLLPRGMFVL